MNMAKLMIHRDLLRTLNRLPAKVQKKMEEFIRKFQENSFQPSLHLEPLAQVQDAKVRSARIGDDYRAILIAPEKGENFLLVHLDHHDEAYRWCRSKRFEAHGETGVLQVFDVQEIEAALQAPASPSLTHPTIPVPSSSLFAAFEDEVIYQAGVPKPLLPAIRAVSSESQFDAVSEYLPPEAGQVLAGLLAGMTLDESLESVLGVKIKEVAGNKPESPGDFSRLPTAPQADLILLEKDEILEQMFSGDFEEWRIFLHPCQRKVVDWNVSGPMKITGSAGTGKTVALLHRAARLARASQRKEPAVLVTTFTANLSLTIKALLERLDPVAAAKIEVTNLHQLARTICLRSNWKGHVLDSEEKDEIWKSVFLQILDKGGLSEDFIRAEFEDVVDPLGVDSLDAYLTTVRRGMQPLQRAQRKTLWLFFTEFRKILRQRDRLTHHGMILEARKLVLNGKFKGYDHVLVDETQDFHVEALRLLAALAPKEPEALNPLALFGDGHQRIHVRYPISLARSGIEVRGRSRRLRINYRTSEEIRQYAQAVLAGKEIDDLDGHVEGEKGDRSLFRGPRPEINMMSSVGQAAVQLGDWIKNLVEHHGFKSYEVCAIPDDSVVREALRRAGLNFLPLKRHESDPGSSVTGVRVASMERVKGLEYRAVGIGLFGHQNEETQEDSNFPFKFYTAITRARERVAIFSLI